jgi:transcriptional regulator with XRE-family HTH domain
VPRAAPLPDDELQICNRFARFRRETGLSRAEFARQCKLETEALARVELGRAPLRFGVFCAVHAAFQLNPVWLLYGVAFPRLSRVVADWEHPKNSEAETSVRQVFESALRLSPVPNYILSDIFDGILASLRNAEDQYLTVLNGLGAASDDALRQGIIDRLANILVARNFLTAPEVSKKPSIERLTNITVSGNMAPVKNSLELLRRRLRKATEARGKKAELARWLSVPLPRISEWLSGGREPGGETALRLLSWVEAEEAKQGATPGVA